MKKLLILFCFIPFALNGQLINIGTTANDGTGDNLRTALGKVNTEVDRIRTYLPNGATPTFPVGGWRLGSITVTSSGLELNILDGALVNATELNYLVGTTSNVQTQLNAKAASSHTHAYEAALGNPANDGYLLSSTTAGVRSWVSASGVTMVYPTSGIALSNGTGWSGSITNNSVNWNSAYTHSISAHQSIISGTGFVKATGTTLSYDNNSYSTTSHNHTGTYEAANSNIQTHIGTTHQTVINGTGFVKASGTTLSYDNSTYASTSQVSTIVHDTIDEIFDNAKVAVEASDSNTYGGYVSYSIYKDLSDRFDQLVAAIEGGGTTDLTPPAFVSAEIGTFADDTILVMLGEVLSQDSIPDASAFSVTEDGDAFGISGVAIGVTGADSLFLICDSAGNFGSTYLLSYTRDYPRLQDAANNAVINWVNKAVTNNVSDVYSAAYQTVYNAMTVKPGADTASLQNAMVESLVSGGYWARMDVFYVFAQRSNTNGEARLNWKAPTGDDNATDAASTTWTKYEGFTGDGVGDYLTTNWNPSSEGVNFTLNSATIGVYSRTVGVDGSTYLGALNTDFLQLGAGSDSKIYARINSDVTSVTSEVIENGRRGCMIATRRAADDVEIYRNGTSIATGAVASTAIPNTNLTILSRSAGAYGDFQIAIAFAMNAVSDAEAAAINTIIETYMDAIGKGVQ